MRLTTTGTEGAGRGRGRAWGRVRNRDGDVTGGGGRDAGGDGERTGTGAGTRGVISVLLHFAARPTRQPTTAPPPSPVTGSGGVRRCEAGRCAGVGRAPTTGDWRPRHTPRSPHPTPKENGIYFGISKGRVKRSPLLPEPPPCTRHEPTTPVEHPPRGGAGAVYASLSRRPFGSSAATGSD